MASSIEAGGSWTTVEDILFCECWVVVGYCPITSNEMKSSHMWRKINGEFCERSGSACTKMALASRWKILNKELGKWRDALTKVRENIRSGQNLGDETSLHDSPVTDSPLDSPVDQDLPIQHESRPIERKAVKAKKGSTSNTKCAKNLKQIAKNGSLRIERDLKREKADKARYEAYVIERQHAQHQDMEDKDKNHGHGYEPYVS
ncbi:unnamed protein product [Prunus brigantina]